MPGLDVERAICASLARGQAQRAFARALAYSKERVQFGKPIAQFQMIQAKLADMYTRVEAARLLNLRAAMACVGLARGGKGTEVHKLAASALLFAAESAEKVVYDAVQIHGGNGYATEFEVNRLYRDVRLGTIGAGTSEIRRLIVARAAPRLIKKNGRRRPFFASSMAGYARDDEISTAGARGLAGWDGRTRGRLCTRHRYLYMLCSPRMRTE